MASFNLRQHEQLAPARNRGIDGTNFIFVGKMKRDYEAGKRDDLSRKENGKCLVRPLTFRRPLPVTVRRGPAWRPVAIDDAGATADGTTTGGAAPPRLWLQSTTPTHLLSKQQHPFVDER